MTATSDDEWLAGEAAVGICFSGGGVRSAAFCLGASQALQSELGLMRGKDAARWLSAVSGGSYIAGAITLLNAGDRVEGVGHKRLDAANPPGDRAPFAPGSPELRHVRNHSRYIVERGSFFNLLTLAWAIVSGAIFAFIFVTFAVACTVAYIDGSGWLMFETIGAWIGLSLSPPPAVGAGLSAAALGVLFGVVVYGRSTPTSWRWKLPVVVIAVGVALWGGRSLATWLRDALPRVTDWAAEHGVGLAIIAAGAAVALIGMWAIGANPKVRFLRVLAVAGVGWLLRFVPLAAYVIAGVWLALWGFELFFAWLDPRMDALTFDQIIWIVIPIMAIVGTSLAFALFGLPLHVPYKRAISRCFGLIHSADGTVRRVVDAKMSSLGPGPRNVGERVVAVEQRSLVAFPNQISSEPFKSAEARGAERATLMAIPTASWTRYPELIVCLAANIREEGSAPAGANVLSMTVDSQSLAVPAENASLPLVDVEVRVGSLSLASLVAISGAAVTPSMGRHTIQNLRTVMMLAGLRLGVWLPNPVSQRVQTEYTGKDRTGISGRILGYYGELFGIHRLRASQLYASDGGHNENLGLPALLRRSCREAWIIDASADPRGESQALMQSLAQAEIELECTYELEPAVFAVDSKTGLAGAAYAEGQLTYLDGTTCKLRVVKLGVTAQHSAASKTYRATDPGFPHHSTLNQIYSADRFTAYRRLGRESVLLAIHGSLQGHAEQPTESTRDSQD